MHRIVSKMGDGVPMGALAQYSESAPCLSHKSRGAVVDISRGGAVGRYNPLLVFPAMHAV